MRLRSLSCINYNEDDYFNKVGVFDDQGLNKHDLIDCILHIINYTHHIPNTLKADYFMLCFDFCHQFVIKFPNHKNFNCVFLQKLHEGLTSPIMNEKQKSSIRFYIEKIKNIRKK